MEFKINRTVGQQIRHERVDRFSIRRFRSKADGFFKIFLFAFIMLMIGTSFSNLSFIAWSGFFIIAIFVVTGIVWFIANK